MSKVYTENLAEFGICEIIQLRDLLNAWIGQGLPDDFYFSGVKPAMSKMSGNVFLTNDDYQVAMMNGDTLESFYSLPYGGAEEFFSNLLDENDPEDLHQDDIDYLLDLAEAAACDLPQAWLTLHIDRVLSE